MREHGLFKTSELNCNEIQQIPTSSLSGLSEKDIKAIQLRYLGKFSNEIAHATGYNESHVRRLFMKDGRLARAYEEYSRQQQHRSEETAALALEKAKGEAQDAIERMIALSKDPTNGPVCYKANEYLLNLAGVSSEISLKGILQKLTYKEAIATLEPLFKDFYGESLQGPRRINIIFGDLSEKQYQEDLGNAADP